MKENKSKKTYMFYVSDYHFEMIALLNIHKELNENRKVVVLTQNDLKETVENVLSKINLKEEEKEEIRKINWATKEKGKFDEIEQSINEKEDITIYIKGSEYYIENQNKKISIIDCYNFSEVANKSGEIIRKYEENLITGKTLKVQK